MAKRTKVEKTNAMRQLDRAKAVYTSHTYEGDGTMSGAEIARMLGEDPARVFKTLVTRAASGEHYVFLVPVERELDLKAAARAVGEKSVSMIAQKELLPLTGYVHGGCSPIGMKKRFTTVVDASAETFDRIYFSAGKIGCQIETTLADLAKAVPFTLAEITT